MPSLGIYPSPAGTRWAWTDFGKLWEQMGPPGPTRALLTYSWHSKRHRLHLHEALDQLAHRCGNEANSCGPHALAGNPQTL